MECGGRGKAGSSEDFHDGPVVKTLPSNAGCAGVIPGEEAKIPHTLLPPPKTKHKTEVM